MRIYFLVLLNVLLIFPVFAQEQFGIASGNYSPTQSLFMNPASIADSRAYRDIHIAGAGFFIDNDLLFFSKKDVKLTRGSSQFEDAPMPLQNSKGWKKHGYADVRIQGPSFTAVFGRFAVGIHTAARSVVDVRGVTPELSNFIFEGLDYTPQQDVVHREKNVRANGMAWSEAGITLGGVIVQSDKNMLSAAVTPRRLFGIAGGGMQVNELNFQVGDSAYFDLDNLDAQVGYAMPAWNSGRGWGFNMGLSYKRMKEDVSDYKAFSKQSNCEAPEYRYKIGISLLDLGSLKFDRKVEFYNVDGLAIDAANYNDDLPSSMEELDSLLNADIGAHITEDGSFRVSLPTALSLQFDWNIGRNFYTSATWIQGIPKKDKLGVQRASVINITPRYELRRFEVAVPVSLYQYRYPRVGLALRFNNIFIGTDRLGPWLLNPDIYGVDLYVGLKYTIFKSRHCKSRKVKAAKLDNGKMVACPKW